MMMKDVKDAIARGRHQSHPTMLKNMRDRERRARYPHREDREESAGGGRQW